MTEWEKEGLPKEILFEGDQELLNKIHDIKKELKESEWSENEPSKVTQPSFLRTDLGEDELSYRFDLNKYNWEVQIRKYQLK